jgi:hypothetical protein
LIITGKSNEKEQFWLSIENVCGQFNGFKDAFGLELRLRLDVCSQFNGFKDVFGLELRLRLSKSLLHHVILVDNFNM